jgi:hypothetical protein
MHDERLSKCIVRSLKNPRGLPTNTGCKKVRKTKSHTNIKKLNGNKSTKAKKMMMMVKHIKAKAKLTHLSGLTLPECYKTVY